jgi:hypothetical protein
MRCLRSLATAHQGTWADRNTWSHSDLIDTLLIIIIININIDYTFPNRRIGVHLDHLDIAR